MSPQMKSLQEVRKLAGAELSLKARLGYVALLLVSAAMTVIVASLWLTEAALPLRTQLAFGVMSVIGCSWVALSVWALGARRPLFARDRVIAGTMAVAFTTLFVASAIVAVLVAGNAASYGVLATGAVMLAIAIRVLHGARRRFAELLARRAALEAA
jgi:hypothetical protein